MATLEAATAPTRPVRAGRLPGPKGRTDVARPTDCPQGHGGRIRLDPHASKDPRFTRMSYRCAYWVQDETGAWVERRHRFTARSAADPLPRRHPTHLHPYSEDSCPHCEHIYKPDDGPRAGLRFYFSAAEIAKYLMAIAGGSAIRPAIAQTRREALRYRRPTVGHRRKPLGDRDATEEERAFLAVMEPLDDLLADRQNWDRLWVDTDHQARHHRRPITEADWVDLPGQPSAEAVLAEHNADLAAGKPPRPRRRRPAPPERTPAEMVDDERFLSRSFALGAEYIDVLGPAICAAYPVPAWPDVLVVDSLPVRRRMADNESDEVARTASDFLCEVVAAYDRTGFPELIALYPASGKDQESFVEFFATKTGQPRWVVTDEDRGLGTAVARAFPNAIHYRCEEHLRAAALRAATRDGLGANTELWSAIQVAQHSPEDWGALGAAVERLVPKPRKQLRDWMARNEDLILHQMVLRERYPDMPYSTGGVENKLVIVRNHLAMRRMSIRNRRRLTIILDLMRLHLAHKARPERWTQLVRKALEELRHGPINWADHWDRMERDMRGEPARLTSSLLTARDRAREVNALAREEEAKSYHVENHAKRAKAAKEHAVAQGGVPAQRGRRAEPEAPIARQGQMVAEVPGLLMFWDHEANAGVDPATVAAFSNKPYAWVCRAHEEDDPEGRWQGHLHRWTAQPRTRAATSAGCRYCTGRAACLGNSIRATHPHLVVPTEWDYASNEANGLSPDAFTFGSHQEVTWLCATHGPYPMEIRFRTRLGQYCRICTEEAGKAKRKETLRVRRRERHVLAEAARKRLAEGPPAPASPEPGGSSDEAALDEHVVKRPDRLKQYGRRAAGTMPVPEQLDEDGF